MKMGLEIFMKTKMKKMIDSINQIAQQKVTPTKQKRMKDKVEHLEGYTGNQRFIWGLQKGCWGTIRIYEEVLEKSLVYKPIKTPFKTKGV